MLHSGKPAPELHVSDSHLLLHILPPTVTYSSPSDLPPPCQEFNGLACLEHLPAWPSLQELLLPSVHPTNLDAGHLALLAAAPSLRRLAFRCIISCADDAAKHAERARLQVRYTVDGGAV